jgi:hypothetical protein
LYFERSEIGHRRIPPPQKKISRFAFWFLYIVVLKLLLSLKLSSFCSYAKGTEAVNCPASCARAFLGGQ